MNNPFFTFFQKNIIPNIIDNPRLGVGYSSDSLIYIIKIFNKDERFVKIGWTSYSLSRRFSSKRSMPYSYIPVLTIATKCLADVIGFERLLHEQFINNKYEPKIKFGGYTECYDIAILDSCFLKEISSLLEGRCYA